MKSRLHKFSARGFTLVEVSVCIVIVAVMLSAVLQTVGQSSVMQYKIADRMRGNQLARMLILEIMQQPYADASGSSTTLGPDGGETRATYNDVDDYTSYADSPPTNKDGSSITVPSASTWRRTVTVTWINPSTGVVVGAETGAKKITVNVYHNSRLAATLSAIRTNAP